MMRFLAALIAFCTLLLTPSLSPARAQTAQPLGILVATEGAVTVSGSAAAADTPLNRGDVVETGTGARALVLLADDSQFTLGENARFTVDDYLFDPDRPRANRGRYGIARGAFLYVSGLMTKNGRPDVKIETSYASIGIRGTIVWGGPVDGGNGVLVQEGEVTVETPAGSTRVRPAEGTRISASSALPSSPSAWDADTIAKAVATITFADQAAADARLAEHKARQQAARDSRKQPASPGAPYNP